VFRDDDGRNVIKGALAGTLLLLSPTAARPSDELSAKVDKDYLSAQQAVEQQKDERVRSHLAAIKEGFDWANVELGQRHQTQLFCQPPKMEVTIDQQFNILERYVKDRDNYMAGTFPLGMIYLSALQQVFPCAGLGASK
jgi:hypothetical protein